MPLVRGTNSAVNFLFDFRTEPEAEPQSTLLPYIPPHALTQRETQRVREFAARLICSDEADRVDIIYNFIHLVVRNAHPDPSPPIVNVDDCPFDWEELFEPEPFCEIDPSTIRTIYVDEEYYALGTNVPYSLIDPDAPEEETFFDAEEDFFYDPDLYFFEPELHPELYF